MGKGNGYHSKTRRLHRKKVRYRGLRGVLSKYLVDYEVGMKVDIVGDPAFQKRGFPHRHFHGKTGTIVELRGRCFGVAVKDGDKMKRLYIGREHIRINRSWQMEQEKTSAK